MLLLLLMAAALSFIDRKMACTSGYGKSSAGLYGLCAYFCPYLIPHPPLYPTTLSSSSSSSSSCSLISDNSAHHLIVPLFLTGALVTNMNSSSTTTTIASPEIECAALLWKLHQKRQLTLHPDQLAWLEAFLDKERLQFEVENDSELKADRQTKIIAAAALLIAGQCQLPLYGLDLETVTGLVRVVVDGL
ncbi:hypothetical protein PYCCODRAFT_335485 [Trametes coccinea BRFM310]|uniref:Cyclin C-terminal domain-containing protein n=1 Tax=Trametes coccinea (strain BRFM310) TaxID=1353009 RepID=A0A1Y2J4B3_TRAC3|nr:hypothetical protein PYCCODRAFT_335485 [Trametes coccinea BRFM310]